ncbi:unnamed protein product [Leuciscus chuanchicus]
MALEARLSNTGAQILAPGGRSVSYKGVGTGGSMVVLFIVVFYLTGSGFGWPSEAPLQEGETLPRTGRNQQGKDRKVAALIPQQQLDESKCTNVELLFHRVSLDHGREGSSAWTETALPEIRDDVNDQCATGTASGSRLGLYTSSKAAWSHHSGLVESESDSGHRSRCGQSLVINVSCLELMRTNHRNQTRGFRKDVRGEGGTTKEKFRLLVTP